jgi:hypothetical protein
MNDKKTQTALKANNAPKANDGAKTPSTDAKADNATSATPTSNLAGESLHTSNGTSGAPSEGESTSTPQVKDDPLASLTAKQLMTELNLNVEKAVKAQQDVEAAEKEKARIHHYIALSIIAQGKLAKIKSPTYTMPNGSRVKPRISNSDSTMYTLVVLKDETDVALV